MTKLNNGFLFRMMTYFAAILFTAGCVYGVVHYRLNAVEGKVKTIDDLPAEVAHQAKDFAEMKDEVKVIDVRVDKVEDAVLVIETKFTTIETNMKEQKVLTEKIWEKVK